MADIGVSTSAMALQALGLEGQRTQMDLIVAVVAQACRSGQTDISLREIQKALLQDHQVALDVSSISGRVTALVAAKRLLRSAEARKCTVSGRDIKPLSAPMVQGRLVS